MAAPRLTRKRILDRGLDLVSSAGLAGVTIGSLAEQVGMSKSGLFAHFGSKEGVQLALLDHGAQLLAERVLAPAMDAPEGLPRLRALVGGWLGWTDKAGLAGGCPVAAAMFEVDDVDTPVRARLLAMEAQWRGLLAQLTGRAVELGHLRSELDVGQFVWELCALYLGHHASRRFVREPDADARAAQAWEALVARGLP